MVYRISYPLVDRGGVVGVRRDGKRVDDGVEAHELFRMMGLLRARTERAHGWGVCRRGRRGHIRQRFGFPRDSLSLSLFSTARSSSSRLPP